MFYNDYTIRRRLQFSKQRRSSIDPEQIYDDSSHPGQEKKHIEKQQRDKILDN